MPTTTYTCLCEGAPYLLCPHVIAGNKHLCGYTGEEACEYRFEGCAECGAKNEQEAETKCICLGDHDDCHGCKVWPQ